MAAIAHSPVGPHFYIREAGERFVLRRRRATLFSAHSAHCLSTLAASYLAHIVCAVGEALVRCVSPTAPAVRTCAPSLPGDDAGCERFGEDSLLGPGSSTTVAAPLSVGQVWRRGYARGRSASAAVCDPTPHAMLAAANFPKVVLTARIGERVAHTSSPPAAIACAPGGRSRFPPWLASPVVGRPPSPLGFLSELSPSSEPSQHSFVPSSKGER